MVEAVHHRAVGVETVDQAIVEVGHEELPGGPVKHDGAETGATGAGDRREQGDRAGATVDTIDAARPAALVDAELAGHPPCVGLALLQAIGTAVAVGIGADNVEAERRRLPDVDVRGQGVVESNREYLACIARAQLEGRVCLDDLASGGRTCRAELEDLCGRSIEIDVEHIERVGARRNRCIGCLDAGKARDDGVAGHEDALILGLGCGRPQDRQKESEQDGCAQERKIVRAREWRPCSGGHNRAST